MLAGHADPSLLKKRPPGPCWLVLAFGSVPQPGSTFKRMLTGQGRHNNSPRYRTARIGCLRKVIHFTCSQRQGRLLGDNDGACRCRSKIARVRLASHRPRAIPAQQKKRTRRLRCLNCTVGCRASNPKKRDTLSGKSGMTKKVHTFAL